MRALILALLLLSSTVHADGHKKKVLGATLIGVGSALDAATTALTFAGLARGGWSLTPRDPTDTALLWSGVAGNFVLDIVLTMGIVIYCQGGDEMRRAREPK
ncbi:MAG: hypothetical protein JWN44_6187 [Myxococcales bacterium]|nr:hypothetical protein [Myxococcales bacterium]